MIQSKLQRTQCEPIEVEGIQDRKEKRSILYINTTLHWSEHTFLLASTALTTLWFTGLTPKANHSNGQLTDSNGLLHLVAVGSADRDDQKLFELEQLVD